MNPFPPSPSPVALAGVPARRIAGTGSRAAAADAAVVAAGGDEVQVVPLALRPRTTASSARTATCCRSPARTTSRRIRGARSARSTSCAARRRSATGRRSARTITDDCNRNDDCTTDDCRMPIQNSNRQSAVVNSSICIRSRELHSRYSLKTPAPAQSTPHPARAPDRSASAASPPVSARSSPASPPGRSARRRSRD